MPSFSRRCWSSLQWTRGSPTKDRFVFLPCKSNCSSEHTAFLGSLLWLGTLLFYRGTLTPREQQESDLEGVFRENGLPNLNPSGVQLLELCVINSLSIANIIFKHKGVHDYMWHPRPEANNWHCSRVIWSSTVCLRHLSTDHPPGNELDPQAGEEVGQICTISVAWDLLGVSAI